MQRTKERACLSVFDFALYFLFSICYLLFAICYLLFSICYLLFAIGRVPARLLISICYLQFFISPCCHLSFVGSANCFKGK